MAKTILRFLAKAIAGFIGLTLVLVVAFKWLPVPVTATMLMDENGITKDWESLDNIDRNLVSAVIASEDQRFCSHSGFDTEAIEKAMRENLEGGKIRGGSSISQQTAKNVFLWQGGGYFRKGLEAWFTFWIELVLGQAADHGGLSQRRRDGDRDLWRRGRSAALFRPLRRAPQPRRGKPHGRRASEPQEARGEGGRRVARTPRQPYRTPDRHRQA